MNYSNPLMMRQGYPPMGYGPGMPADDGSMRPRPWLQPGYQAQTGGPGQMQGGPNAQTGGGMQPMPMGMPTMHPNMGGGLPPLPQQVNTGGGLPPMAMPNVQTGGPMPMQGVGLARMGGGQGGQFNNRLLGRGLMR